MANPSIPGNQGGRPPASELTDAQIAGYASSVDHHAALINSFGFGFANIYALFNAGAFSAIVAILPTEFGKELSASYPVLSKWTLGLFALGFVFSTCFMAAIMQYGIGKYRHYRNLLRGNGSVDESSPADQSKITTVATVFIIPMLLSTVIGTWFALHMIIFK